MLLQAAQFEAEYQAAVREADDAQGRDKSVLEAKAGKVKAKLDDALTKVTAIEVVPLPKVEVRAAAEGGKCVCVCVCLLVTLQKGNSGLVTI